MIPFLEDYSEYYGREVFVYRNLTRKCWSVRCIKGKVLFHTYQLLLGDCLLKVSESGRQRVLREKKKYVHAGIRGKLITKRYNENTSTKIGYNPTKGGTFFEYDSGLPVFDSPLVRLTKHNGVFSA